MSVSSVLSSSASTAHRTSETPPRERDEGAVTVRLSKEAQEGIRAAAVPQDLASLAKKARQAIDLLYVGAQKQGTPPSEAAAGGGRAEETFAGETFAMFSDRALAAIALDKTGLFSREETEFARTALRESVHKEAEAFAPGGRAEDNLAALNYSKSLAKAYDSADRDVRAALKWRPEHRRALEMGLRYYEKEVAGDSADSKEEEMKSLIKQLQGIIDSQRKLVEPPKLGEEEEESGSILEQIRKLLKKILKKAAKKALQQDKSLPGGKMTSPEELFELLQLAAAAAAMAK